MSDPNSSVEYRAVEGFPGYRVGDDGSVWTAWRMKGTGRAGKITKYIGTTWKSLKGRVNCRSHRPEVRLYRNGKAFTYKIQNIVLAAFSGPRPVGLECCHFDGNRLNNTALNLRWGTKTDNAADRERHGNTCRGERNGCSRLTEYQASEILRRRRNGESGVRLSKEFNVTPSTIWLIYKKKKWKHLT